MFEIIKQAGRVGTAKFEFFVTYGRLPTKDDDLTEFLVDGFTLNE